MNLMRPRKNQTKGNRRPVNLPPLLQQIKFYFDVLTRSSDAYYFMADIQNGLTLISRNWVEDFDLPGENLPDMDAVWTPLLHPDDLPRYMGAQEAMFVRRVTDEHNIVYRARDREGQYVWLKCRGSLLVDEEKKPQFFGGVMVRLEHLNQADSVTGLLSKTPFENAVREALDDFRRTGVGGQIVLLGIDNFKIVNETYNRAFGDQVLRATAEQINNILPPGVTLYKMDGDEFGLILPGAGEGQVNRLFRAIQTCMSRQQFIDGRMYFCTMSGGTVAYPQGGRDYQVLYKHAEAALDLAKQDGKNNNVIFTREQYNRWIRSMEMRHTLKDSVENGCEGFELFFQPQVEAVSQKLVGAEALLRWKNPKGRMVSPMEFIPILEETKMILPLGKWIVEKACKVCRKWRERVPDFHMSINVSYPQIKDVTFLPFVEEAMERIGLPPNAVTLELTESIIVSDWSFLNQQFDEFRQQGIRIAMDDFGTGYSSLAYLKKLSCDVVKVDREFVKNIQERVFDRRLVKYTVDLCHSLNMKVCIEGVEDEAVYDIVTRDCQADYIQGYFFGRPVSEREFEETFINASGGTP